ncbi:MAG: acyP [Gammaproteobacteria bacterium]|jgi:acylphosphatase|nr:acyP [Gammaproteobacteria bacterium]
MKQTSGRHFFASGRVQGVFYRKFCRNEAQKLGLTGWAKNLNDGRVEVIVYGDDESLAFYEKKLQSGPILSKVTSLSKKTIPFEVYEGFDIY